MDMKQRTLTLLAALLLLATQGEAQMKRSVKRGICENDIYYTEGWVDSLKCGVSWTYDWTITPRNPNKWNAIPSNLGPGLDMDFAPMCWNADYDEATLRSYLSTHPGVKYLLGFNEPNFSAQAKLTPAQAAQKWPALEQIAADYGLELVSPALNFTGETVGGRVWQPYDWLDTFIAEYRSRYGKDPRMDYIALHCYMNWSGALEWFVNDYMLSDIYNSENDATCANIRGYFERNGKKQVMLTEFCAWEGDKDGFTTSVDSQIEQMVLKVQAMELSPNVAAYAWFMGKGGRSLSDSPYYRVFQDNTDNSRLSRLGTIYANLSSFDTTWYHPAGTRVAAKDYVGSSNVKVDLNTDGQSDQKIEVKEFFRYSAWDGTHTPSLDYQVDIPAAGQYDISLRVKSSGTASLQLWVDGTQVGTQSVAATSGQWATRTIKATLPAGEHTLRLVNTQTSAFALNWFTIELPSAIGQVAADAAGQAAPSPYYRTDGTVVSRQSLPAERGIYVHGGKKVVVR